MIDSVVNAQSPNGLANIRTTCKQMLTFNGKVRVLALALTTYTEKTMDAAQQFMSTEVTASAKKIAHNVNARYALSATAFLVAAVTAWAALVWVWYSRAIKIPDLPPIVPPVTAAGPAAGGDDDNKRQCEGACTHANTKNLEGPMWLAIAGALVALALFIAALTIPSVQDYLRKIRSTMSSPRARISAF